jgi:hypothetical protein
VISRLVDKGFVNSWRFKWEKLKFQAVSPLGGGAGAGCAACEFRVLFARLGASLTFTRLDKRWELVKG